MSSWRSSFYVLSPSGGDVIRFLRTRLGEDTYSGGRGDYREGDIVEEIPEESSRTVVCT